ncbi:MAG: hypothetical protein LM550_16695 [Candidatus Contendobacter sp.]|jgi:hypothetical protein|nr:hypothetical protein [Gammaproteobacteria bacterium]MCC8995281.1 hypothetical protein [Candidatus Contendobacter sp.]
MKVNVSVEATALEMREFLGLPNIQPLHDDILQKVRDNMQRGVINFDALGLMKPLLPTHFNSMEMVQKFWETVAKASGGNQAKDLADRKAEPAPESDNGSIRNGVDKA